MTLLLCIIVYAKAFIMDEIEGKNEIIRRGYVGYLKIYANI